MNGSYGQYPPPRILRLIYHIPNFIRLFWRLLREPRVPIYKKALPIIAEEIRYGPHQLKSVLEGIEKRMKRLNADSKTLIRFGKTLFDLWVREDLDQVHLEALDYFIAWKGGEYSDA